MSLFFQTQKSGFLILKKIITGNAHTSQTKSVLHL